MLKITISGPKIDSAEGEICVIDVRREVEGGISWEKSFMVHANNYREALKSAMGIVEREKLDQ